MRQLHIYTDASRNDESSVGVYGCFVRDSKVFKWYDIQVGKSYTIVELEVLAVSLGLKYILSNDISEYSKIVFHVDSEEAIKFYRNASKLLVERRYMETIYHAALIARQVAQEYGKTVIYRRISRTSKDPNGNIAIDKMVSQYLRLIS